MSFSTFHPSPVKPHSSYLCCQAHTCGITNTSELLCWGSPVDETLAVSCSPFFFCVCCLAFWIIATTPSRLEFVVSFYAFSQGATWQHMEPSRGWYCLHLCSERHWKHILLGKARQAYLTQISREQKPLLLSILQ